MKYGLIGEHLGHSFSRVIHAELSDYDYELCEVARDKLDDFLLWREFSGINVTIPYKERVIPYLHFIDEDARAIGAVNTVVNRDGKLYGYNTDFFGMRMLFEHAKISVSGKKAAILGSGGTSKTALGVLKSLGAREIIRVSRGAGGDTVTYRELTENHRDIEILVNTTPLGMFPNIYDAPVDISDFDNLSGVIDVIYNPQRTPLINAARMRGIPSAGGLYMLVGQAVRASEIFLGTSYPDRTLDSVYEKIRRDKENIVLIGMPASGKSTVGGILKKALGRRLVDTDELIVSRCGMEIPEIFKRFGEEEFRRIESEVIREIAKESSLVIATGGGAVLKNENVSALRQNGRLFFIDRPLEMLVPTASRPLSSDRAAIEKRYSERYGIYSSVCDVRIDADCSASEVAKKITEAF